MRVRVAVAVLVILSLVGACGPAQTRTVKFKVSGDTHLASIKYSVNGKTTTVDHPKLPWNLTLKLQVPYEWTLALTSVDSGTRSVDVYDNGALVSSGGGGGKGTSNFSGSYG